MVRVQTREIYEAKELLAEIDSWFGEEMASFPRFYREKAQEYRRLANGGEREDTIQT